MTSRLGRTAKSAFRLLRTAGPRAFAAKALERLSVEVAIAQPTMLVFEEDAARVDWASVPTWRDEQITVPHGPVEIAWIISPPGETSGGHQNLFRFIDFAEKAGHHCTVYLYTTQSVPVDIPAIRAMLTSSAAYPEVAADIVMYDRTEGVFSKTQALFATGWETAYPAYLDQSTARRFYFIQDYESSFYPLGTESLLAENTYRFGFHGITAGAWLSHKMRTEYGMQADHFDFAVDKAHYSVTNPEHRKEIFFYARPVTARRAFEFGLLALRDFAEMRPDVTINLAGWDVSGWDIPFPHVNLAAMDISELNDVYNRCAAGIVLSLSNMSLLPLELISSGVSPVVNDAPNNRMVSDNPYIEYVPASPRAIAKKLVEILDRPDASHLVKAMSASVSNVNWSDSGAQFVHAFESAMHGG